MCQGTGSWSVSGKNNVLAINFLRTILDFFFLSSLSYFPFSSTEVRPALLSDSFPDLLQLFHILSHPINLLYIKFLLESVSWRTQAKRYGARNGSALWDHLFTTSRAHLMISRIVIYGIDRVAIQLLENSL